MYIYLFAIPVQTISLKSTTNIFFKYTNCDFLNSVYFAFCIDGDFVVLVITFFFLVRMKDENYKGEKRNNNNNNKIQHFTGSFRD